jgi:hypothetical protein
VSLKTTSILILLVLAACGFSSASVNRDEMNARASSLTKLAAAMESYVRYGEPPAGASEAELLAAGTRHDARLLGDLAGLKLRLLSQDRHAVLLVCSQDGERALLEDAGCTGKMDVHRWERDKAPCEFTLAVKTVCEVK